MTKYYRLEEAEIVRRKGQLVTQAFILCGLCGSAISSNGGPGSGSVCKPCGDLLRRGELRSCVDWSEAEDETV